MNTYELCAQMVANGFLPSNHPNFSMGVPTQLIKELNGVHTQNFGRHVINAREGYWEQTTIIPTIVGDASYDLPERCAHGGFDRIELALSPTSEFMPIDCDQEDTQRRAGAPSNIGQPRTYMLRGNRIVLLPAPDSAAYRIRIWYYQRPSQIVRPQSPTFTEIASIDSAVVDRGRITSIAGIGSRQVVVNAIPFRQRQGTPAAIVTAVDRIDVIKPSGWHELTIVGATQTISGTTITIGGSRPSTQNWSRT